MLRQVLLASLVALVPLPVLATTVLPLTRADLATRADTIVRAKVGPQAAVRSEKTGRILTRSKLTVLATYKGEAKAELELEQMGGTLDGATLVVPGDARLGNGEEVVLYLRCAGKARCHVFGLGLGKYGVRTEKDGRKTAIRDLQGLKSLSGQPLPEERALPLADLERELKGARR
ncbi:MAG TPA: hypothetical protein VGK67_12550 [Myxococcales bacterium]|jgi:hypothetical protein